MNQISNCNGLIQKAFNSVSQSQSELIQSLSSACHLAMYEVASTNPQWQDSVRKLIVIDGSERYIGFSKGEHNSLAELFDTESEATALKLFQPTAETIIRLVESGDKADDGYQQIIKFIKKITLKSLQNYRKLLHKNNFDYEFLEDRVQEAAIEIIRAARCYRDEGIAAFDTFASARVKTAVNRKEMKNHLMLKVSDQDISNAYAKAVEINSKKVCHDMAKASDFLPKRAHHNETFNEYAAETDGMYTNNQIENMIVVSNQTQKKLNSFLALKLKSLNDSERLVLFNEVGLVGESLPRVDVIEHLGVTSARYTQIKASALNKIGMFKKVSPAWRRALS